MISPRVVSATELLIVYDKVPSAFRNRELDLARDRSRLTPIFSSVLKEDVPVNLVARVPDVIQWSENII